MAERYNAPLIDFDPFRNNDEHENRRKVVGRFILTASIIGLSVVGIIIFMINHQSSQANDDSNTFTQESTVSASRDIPEEQPVRKEDALYVSGIVGGGVPVAIIGGQMLKAGDMVQGYHIKSIGSNFVEFLDKSGHLMIKEVGK